MSEDIKAQVRAIAHEIARREVFEHELRFTLSGALLGAVAVLSWLVATGRFDGSPGHAERARPARGDARRASRGCARANRLAAGGR